ncbi:MAG: hypothetical protein ABSF64_27385 [Bryobacteraceae bacterium]|jgi:hypothetical protein
MSRNRRERLVVFRLSQDEYLKLKAASESSGARNLSDFTRGEVLSFLNSQAAGARLDETLGPVVNCMAELQETMLRLQSTLEGLNNNATSAAGS